MMLSKVLKLNYLVATPAFLGAALLVSSSAFAAESQAGAEALLNTAPAAASTTLQIDTTAQVAPIAPAAEQASVTPVAPIQVAQAAPAAPVETAQAAPAQTQAAPAAQSVASLDDIVQYGNEVSTTQSQVTSISQLSDVQPTDWAFQALQSLVERYGCIAGYPDGTYRGQRAMTRFEFAAGLNACLDRISELIASSTADLATKEDLATLRRLQDEFQAELSTLRGRVDALESRTSELEANQFSTTTKLNGEVIIAAAAPIDYDDDAFDDQANLGYRVRLNFDTSFTGEDLLRTRLQVRNFQSYDSLAATPGMNWSFGDSPSGGSTGVTLNQLFYQFPLGDRVTVLLGANATSDTDYVTSSISPFDSSGSGSLTAFGTPQQYNLVTGGTGLGLFFQLTDNLNLDLSYATSEGPIAASGAGLFNGDNSFLAQLTFLSDFVDLGLMYANTYLGGGFGFLNEDRPEVANVYGGQVNFKFGALELGGGVAYAPIRAINRGDYDVWSYQGTVAVRDLGGRGNLLGILFGSPLYAAGFGDGTFLTGLSDVRSQDTPFAVEGFYRFRVNSNIAITPGIVWLTNPGNNDSNSDSIAGVVRTTFTF